MKKCLVAGVLIMSEDGKKVLLVKHKKLGVWIYPGGHLEDNENPLECAMREAREETGASFEIMETDKFRLEAVSARSTPLPLVIMKEQVPYKNGPHEHFDMIYLGRAKSRDFKRNEESSDCKWFSRDSIDSIETYDNVKEIIRYGFETFQKLKEGMK